jgi:protein-L-isoaspartate(D-aspartate) O-methyltransferase
VAAGRLGGPGGTDGGGSRGVRRDASASHRARLVAAVRARGVSDAAVLEAVGAVPRHLFVPAALRSRAYDDTALPIGNGQTISQPSTQARCLAALRLTARDRVLEIGTGSGYQTALLARLAGQVFSVERVQRLREEALAALQAAGVTNVSLLLGDGTLGWRDYAPYDAIVVAAASPEVPQPLLDQLAPRGRMLLPLGERAEQVLTLVTAAEGRLEREPLAGARFVPLLGTFGFDA